MLGIQYPLYEHNTILNNCDLITLCKFYCNKKKKFLKTSQIFKLIKKRR